MQPQLRPKCKFNLQILLEPVMTADIYIQLGAGISCLADKHQVESGLLPGI